MGIVLGLSVLVFLFSPKTIGTALGAENLDVQTPGLWTIASSAGVFCALAILVLWLLAVRRGSPAQALHVHPGRAPSVVLPGQTIDVSRDDSPGHIYRRLSDPSAT